MSDEAILDPGVTRPARPTNRARKEGRVFRYTVGALIVLLFFVPLLYVLMIAFESGGHFLRSPLTPPVNNPKAGNFAAAWRQADLGIQLLNTILYSVIAAGLSTVLSLLIAFPIARRITKWSEKIYRLFTLGLFLPVAIIPLFIESQKLHLYNNRIGYILLHVEPGIPLGVVLLTAVITSLPRELDEAAQVDGCGYMRYLATIVSPLVAAGLVVVFLYSLLGVWNDIIGPVVFLNNPNLFPISRGIFSFYGSHESDWTLLAAAIVIASLPVLILFVLTQRKLVRATIGGAIKQ